MAKINHIDAATNAIIKKIAKVSQRFAEKVTRLIEQGVKPSDAVQQAVKSLDMAERLKVIYMDGIEGMLKGMNPDNPSGVAFRKWYLNKVYPGEDLSLSGKINDLSKFSDLKQTIKQSLRENESWTKLAQNLTDKELTKETIPKYMKELVDKGRHAMRGNEAAIKDYRKALATAEKNISRLSENGAPTQRLKVAYQSVIDATNRGSEKAISQSIEKMSLANARYNAERIARTETAKAYAQQTYVDVLDDEDVIGIGYDLNDGHPKPDICDFHTSVDLYGLGAGRYPLNALPKFPFHPNCICQMYSVYEGDVSGLDSKAAQSYLKKLPAEKRRSIMGTKGAAEFEKAPAKWDKNLPNYSGHESVDSLLVATKLKS